MSRRLQAGVRLMAVTLGLCTAPLGVAAQAAGTAGEAALSPLRETAMLRQASAFEWQGRLDEAESVLTEVLRRNPTSSSALFSLERILRNRERTREILTWADRFVESDPSAAAPRYLKLRVLAEIDSLSAIGPVARAWYAADPDSELPYREVARVLEDARGAEAALGVLNEGRRALGGGTALALEIGDVRQRAGDADGAVEAWARALESPQADVSGVVRRVRRLGTADIAPVLEALQRHHASDPERWLAALDLALERGSSAEPGPLARRGAAAVPESDLEGFLREVARRSERFERPDLSLWALQTLRERGLDRGGSSADDARLFATALAAGDTAEAVGAQLRRVRGLSTGTEERRNAIIDLVRTEARWSGTTPEALVERWHTVRHEFEAAAGLDALTALLVHELLARGDLESGEVVAASDPGPRTRAEQGWLRLLQGQVVDGRAVLQQVAPALDPEQATRVLETLASLSRVDAALAAPLGEAWALVRHGAADEGLARVEAVLVGVPDEQRAPLHFSAARMAIEGGQADRAESHLLALILAAGEAAPPELPEAMLTRARLAAASPDRLDEAIEMLTQLILNHPEAAVIPDARRMLEELQRGDR
jgi:tetratricopeptide (TPR) repeat protein